MRIKTLTAPRMEDALRVIREQLGPEALILSTRKVKNAAGEQTLEITAAVAEDESPSKPVETVAETRLPGAEPARPKPVPSLFNSTLEAHGLPHALVAKINAALPGLLGAGFTQAEALDMLLSKIVKFKSPLEILAPGKTHVLIGPHGAGKTTLIAKLAIQAKKQGRTVGILSLDDQKIGGFEPLAIAAEIMGEAAHLVTSVADLKNAGAALGPRHLVLIDTPGINPYDPAGLTRLAQKMGELSLPATTHLVLPASLNAADMATLPVACHRFNLQSIIFTKLDSTSRYGALLSTAESSNLPLGIATHSADMATPPLTLTSTWLAEALAELPRQPWEFTS